MPAFYTNQTFATLLVITAKEHVEELASGRKPSAAQPPSCVVRDAPLALLTMRYLIDGI
jgi:hypothetical protein